MENQVNLDNQDTQQINKNEINQQSIHKKSKLNYWMILTVVLSIILVCFLSWFFLGHFFGQKKNNPASILLNNSPTPVVIMKPSKSVSLTNTPIILKAGMPRYGAFMRRGEVYFKNFLNNQEIKVSRVQKVGSPKLSPNGKYVVYFSINHDAGGFPRGDVFVASIDGSFEKKIGSTNKVASKVWWSRDGNYLGIILFAEEIPTSDNFFAEALLLDVSIQKDIARTRVDLGQNQSAILNNQYDVNLNCSRLETKYLSFCEEFVAHTKTKIPFPDYGYKAEEYKNSSYVKPGYKLIKSIKIDNDLVVLEFYSGKPKNPESQWGIAGGVFVPGYDEGVTETYTLLLNEKTGEVILEIPLAVDADFLF